MRVLPGLLLLSLMLLTQMVTASSLPAASSPYILNAGFEKNTQIGLNLDILEDKYASLSIEGAISAAEKGEFLRSTRGEHSVGTTTSAWWARLTLINKTDQLQELVLQQGYPHIDKLQLWEEVNGQLQQRETGDMLPFSQREIAVNALPFLLKVAANSTHTVFLRYKTSGAMSIDLTIYKPIAFAEAKAAKQMIQGIFYGALIALALYNLFIFFIIRDSSYFYYVAYIVTFGLFIAGFSGYNAQYLWPESPWLSNISLLFFWGIVIAMALVFSKRFLNLKLDAPYLNHIANIFIVIAVCCSVAALYLPYAAVIKVLFLLAPPSYLLILIAGYKAIQRGSVPALYFMTGWATLMVTAIAATLISAGIIPEYASYSPYIIESGAFVEMILLSIALASRIRNLEQDLLTDGLTSLYNRRFFDIELPRMYNLSKRHQKPLSLLLVDIDKFKDFNDTYGHDQGDIALQKVSMLLAQEARHSDYVCRYGGEEFAIILPNTLQSDASRIAERMRSMISKYEIEGKYLTVSIGVAIYDGEDNMDVKTLFKNTDESLYKAKQNGRNRVVEFDAALTTT